MRGARRAAVHVRRAELAGCVRRHGLHALLAAGVVVDLLRAPTIAFAPSAAALAALAAFAPSAAALDAASTTTASSLCPHLVCK